MILLQPPLIPSFVRRGCIESSKMDFSILLPKEGIKEKVKLFYEKI
jgi:hypothetical protein